MDEKGKDTEAQKKHIANWCMKCGKEHENMGVEKCGCGGKTQICYGPPEIKSPGQVTGRFVPF